MKRYMVVLLGVALAASAGTYVLTHEASGPAKAAKVGGDRAANHIDPREWAALRQEVAALRAEVAGLKRQLAVPIQAGPPAPPQEQASGRPDPLAQAEEERLRRQQMDAVETAFRNEPSDPAWSTRTGSLVQGVLARNQTAQTALRTLECRSRTCRVEIASDGAKERAALAKFMPLFALQVGTALPSMTVDEVEDPSGAVTTILYLSRDPDPPPEGEG